MNHDPPLEEKERLVLFIQPHRSFEWWETLNGKVGNDDSNDSNGSNASQIPYKDEYSQLIPCETVLAADTL